MILYDICAVNDDVEFSIADGITIYKTLDAVKKDIKEQGLEQNTVYKFYEYDDKDEQEIKRVFELRQV